MNRSVDAEIGDRQPAAGSADCPVTVSVILLVYNHEKYLARALDNILSQKTDFRFEVIIGDDASTDGSAAIIKDYELKHPGVIVPVLRETNIGASRNYADLFRRCSGKYITCTEGDDYWCNDDKLKTQVDYLEQNAGLFSVSHRVEVRDSNDRAIGVVPKENSLEGEVGIRDVLNGKRFAFTATLMRSIPAEEYEAMLEAVEAGPRNACDLTVALYMLDRGRIPILREMMSVYCYRLSENETNYNSTTPLADRIRNRIKLISVNDRFFRGKYNFFWMYFRLVGAALRQLLHFRPADLIELPPLIVKLLLLSLKSVLMSGLGSFRSGDRGVAAGQ